MAVFDTIVLGSKVDGVIIVHKMVGYVDKITMQRTKSQFRGVEDKLWGVVLIMLK